MKRDMSIKKALSDLAQEIFHLDSKTYRSLKALFFQPGKLTETYIESDRDYYAKPLKIYLIANLIFFLIGPQLGMFTQNLESLMNMNSSTKVVVEKSLAENSMSYEEYEAVFNTSITYKQPTFLIIIIHLFAVIFRVFHWKRYYLESLIFSLHSFTFMMLSSLIYFSSLFSFYKLIKIFGFTQNMTDESFQLGFKIAVLLFIILCIIYLIAANRRVFKDSVIISTIVAVFSFTWLVFVIAGYNMVIFYVTLLSI